VQLAALWILKSRLHINYLVATALAVQLAVLHNFLWHERFTWKDRAGGSWRAVAGRLLRFEAGNGLVSLLGNLGLMRLFVGGLGMKYMLANAIAIALCSIFNFAAGEWYVFRKPR
jgi:putative flippase GtrA